MAPAEPVPRAPSGCRNSVAPLRWAGAPATWIRNPPIRIACFVRLLTLSAVRSFSVARPERGLGQLLRNRMRRFRASPKSRLRASASTTSRSAERRILRQPPGFPGNPFFPPARRRPAGPGSGTAGPGTAPGASGSRPPVRWPARRPAAAMADGSIPRLRRSIGNSETELKTLGELFPKCGDVFVLRARRDVGHVSGLVQPPRSGSRPPGRAGQDGNPTPRGSGYVAGAGKWSAKESEDFAEKSKWECSKSGRILVAARIPSLPPGPSL